MHTKLLSSALLSLALLAPLTAQAAETILMYDNFKGTMVTFPDGRVKNYLNPNKWAFTFWPGTVWPDSYGDGTNWLDGNNDCQTYVTPFITHVLGTPIPPSLRYDPFTIKPDGLYITAGRLSQKQRDLYQAKDCRRWGSGLLMTRETFKYGKLKLVARMPSALGSWPALWLLPVSHEWPPEIDVFEIMAWGSHKKQLASAMLTPKGEQEDPGKAMWYDLDVDPSKGFNEYEMDWNENTISVSFNGRELWRKPTPPSMKQPMYVLINLGVGGRWPFNEMGIQPIDSQKVSRLNAGALAMEPYYPASMILKSFKVWRD